MAGRNNLLCMVSGVGIFVFTPHILASVLDLGEVQRKEKRGPE